MRLELRADRPGALPLLPAVPSHRICRLEGYNGIGKTLSVRLLEICTGRQPYRGHKLAWNALRKGLGPVTARVSDLTGADTIEWQFNTGDWGEVDEDVVDEWFDITIDGAAAGLADVRRLLSVHRIAGNEGLVGTLSQQIRADAELVRHWQRRYSSGEQAPLQQVLALVGRARELLSRQDEILYRELRDLAKEASKAAAELRGELERTEGRLENLELAATLSHRIAELDAADGSFERDLADLDRDLRLAEQQVEGIREQLGQVEQRVEQSEAAREQLTQVRKLRTGRLNRLEAATKELVGGLQIAGVQDPSQAPERLVEVRDELERLVVRRAAVDAGPRMRSLLDELGVRLERAEREGLSTQELLATSGVTLSVSEAREAFGARAEALAGVDESDAGAALTRRIADNAARVRALEGLADQARKVRRAHELLEEADEQIREFVDSADEKAGEEAERLRPALRNAEDEARRIAVARASMRRHQETLTGGGSVEDLRRERDELLSLTGSTVDAVVDEVADTRTTLASLRLRKEEAELQEREAGARVGREQRLVTDAVTALAFSDEYRWIRFVDPDAVPAPDDPIDRQLELLGALRRRIERVAGRASDLGTQMGGIGQSLADLSEQVRSGQAAVEGRGYLPALRGSLGEQYSGYFNEPEVRNALLPTALRATINLESMTVEWEEPDGEGGSRPLEAFSSGQQAFAYTRAMLAGLNLEAGPRAVNRLIALDEFGAFVARNRVEDLIAMLRAHRDRHETDQLLVILPVAEDYPDQLAGDPPKHLQPRLERIVKDLKNHHYFTEEFAL